MKKPLLALATTLLLPNISYAAACVDGANAAGCTISTTDITYTLTGDIEPASGVNGITFNSGADRNNVTLTGNISTKGDEAYGLLLLSSDNNTTSLTGNITTTGDFFAGGLLYLYDSDSNTTSLTGNITTTGDNVGGLWLYDSDSNTTTLTGDISTGSVDGVTGIEAFGLYLDNSNNNTTTLTGNISTTGSAARGLLLLSSDNNTTTLIGDIDTTGIAAHGLSLDNSDSNSINLTGDIDTSGSNGRGFHLTSSNSNTIVMTGNITTTNTTQSDGIYFNESSNNNLQMIGNISTASPSGISLTSNSDNNFLNISGDITTTGSGSYGTYLYNSDSNDLTISGDISTSGLNAYGYYLETSNSNTIIHSGDIVTTNQYAYGIHFNQARSNAVTMMGNISTSDNYGYGLYLYESSSADSRNTITLTGNISTTGSSSQAVHIAYSNLNTVTMTGNISTTGTAAHGLYLYGSDSNTVTMTGGISATGSSAYAIYADSTSDNNTINLTLNRGDRLVGGIYNDGSGNTLNITLNSGRTASYMYTSSGSTDLTWNITDSSKPVINGSAKSRGIADIDDEGNKLYQRFNPISRATSAQHKNVARGDSRHDVWVDGYYSDSDRTTSLKELNQKTRGLTVGFNVSGDRQLPLDFIINFENTDTGYGQSDQSIDSNSMMVGLSYPQLMQAFNGSLALQFLTGAADNDSAIKVLNNTVSSGQETVNADYTSYYAMVGADWLQPLYQGENIQHDLYLGLDVMHEKINSHSSSSYFYMSDRDITQLTSSMHYGFAFNSSDKKLRILAKAGIEQTDMLEGEYQYYKVDGTATRFKGDERNTYMTASLGADYKFTDNAKAYFNVQKFDSSDDIDGTTGNVGLVVNF